jgi:hypothetical protein
MDCLKDDPADRPASMMAVISRLDLMIHSILSGKAKTNSNSDSQ